MSEVATIPGRTRGRMLVGSPFYVLRGALFLWNHPVLWKYAAAPIGMSLLVLSVAYYLLYRFFVSWIGGFVGQEWYWQALYYVLVVFASVLVLVAFFFIFILLAKAISAPFNELISEKTEELVAGRFHAAPFSFIQLFKDSGRGIAHSLRILAVYLGLIMASLFFLLVPGIGVILYTVTTVLISAYMLAYEYLGCPMDRRRFSFREKRLFLRSHLRWAMGFGLGNALIASIPGLNIMFIPAAVVGGTLLFLDLDDLARGSSEVKPEAAPTAGTAAR
jgi:CysZ protein